MQLPFRMFYGDFVYSYVPLKSVRTLRYENVDLYRYAIGRVDQSVHEDVMVNRLDQLWRVNDLMVRANPDDAAASPHRRLPRPFQCALYQIARALIGFN